MNKKDILDEFVRNILMPVKSLTSKEIKSLFSADELKNNRDEIMYVLITMRDSIQLEIEKLKQD